MLGVEPRYRTAGRERLMPRRNRNARKHTRPRGKLRHRNKNRDQMSYAPMSPLSLHPKRRRI